jgi:hypothetical protein
MAQRCGSGRVSCAGLTSSSAQSVGREEGQGVELLIDLDTPGVHLCVSEIGLWHGITVLPY